MHARCYLLTKLYQFHKVFLKSIYNVPLLRKKKFKRFRSRNEQLSNTCKCVKFLPSFNYTVISHNFLDRSCNFDRGTYFVAFIVQYKTYNSIVLTISFSIQNFYIKLKLISKRHRTKRTYDSMWDINI